MLNKRKMINGFEDGRLTAGNADHPHETDESCSRNVSVAPFLTACLLAYAPMTTSSWWFPTPRSCFPYVDFRRLENLTGIVFMYAMCARDPRSPW